MSLGSVGALLHGQLGGALIALVCLGAAKLLAPVVRSAGAGLGGFLRRLNERVPVSMEPAAESGEVAFLEWAKAEAALFVRTAPLHGLKPSTAVGLVSDLVLEAEKDLRLGSAGGLSVPPPLAPPPVNQPVNQPVASALDGDRIPPLIGQRMA